MKNVLLGAAAAAALLACALPAGATVIFQSIANQTIAPVSQGCSSCSSALPNHVYLGEFFSLGSQVTVRSLTVAIAAQTDATALTVGIYRNNGGVLDQQLYDHTFTSYDYKHVVYDGPGQFDDSELVGVNLGNLSLKAGNYVVMFSNPADFFVGVFTSGAGHGVIDTEGPGDFSPAPGDLLKLIGTAEPLDLAVAISDQKVGPAGFAEGGSGAPEPAAWALMLGGFGLAGATLRRRARTATAA